MSKIKRRDFLLSSAPLITVPSLLSALPAHAAARGRSGILEGSSLTIFTPMLQSEWRWCTRCYMLFWNGEANKGLCAAGGGHSGGGPGTSNYFLHCSDKDVTYHSATSEYGPELVDSPVSQVNWRFCAKCYVMFYTGSYPAYGRCAAGGAHNPQGLFFSLQHDVPEDANNQAGWRFCTKCYAMFWDAYQSKGNCPGGGGHAGQGYKFVLPHDPRPDFHVRANVTTDGWAPIGGWVDISAKQNGDLVFSGHVHNSGAINIRFTLAAVLISPCGISYGFAVNDRRVDGTEVIIGRNRDFDWNSPKNDPTVAFNWNQFSNARLAWRLVASSAVGSGITNYLKTIAWEVYKRLPRETQLFTDPPMALILSL